MAKEMLINVSEGEECRIALLDDGHLEELYMERTSSTSHVGNIYKGRVTNVEASIQAAFVDFGLGRNGFLHISDLMPTYFGRKGEDIHESVGKKMARRDRPPIQRCLRRGDEIVVQIIKEGIGTKGPTLSTYLSIPGRILVMMPGMGKMGVSKKIEDEEERRRLRTILDSLKPPKGVGFIIRTAGIGRSKAEIQRDLTYLSRLWQQIEKIQDSGPGPLELYTEGDLVARTVRDVFTGDVDRVIVDNKDVAKRVKEVVKITSPRTRNKVEVYEEPIPLFHKYGIEKDIELMYSRHVPLPSGGSLVIDSTEAIVAIDVNSGKFRDHSDAEMTAFKTDLEAADEIPRQLKLRDLGGVIICDFIDLRYERHRRELEEKLHENFKKDRAKTKVLRMSQFGIIEITRQRMRPSLKRSIYFDCPHCKGAGLVKTPESMSLDVMRKLAMAAHHEKVARIELSVCPDVSFYLLNKKRASLARLESESRRGLVVRPDPTLGLDEMKFDLFDARDGLIVIDELGLGSQPPHTTQLHTRPAGRKGRGGRDGGGRDNRGGRNQQRGRQLPPPRDVERDFEDMEDVIEERRERTPADEALAASIAPKIVSTSDQTKGKLPADDDDHGGMHGEVNEEINGEIVADVNDDALEPVEDEEDENVVDIEDGHSELGERPAGEWDRQGYGDRGRNNQRNRGRDNRGGRGGGRQDNRQGGGQNNRRDSQPQGQRNEQGNRQGQGNRDNRDNYGNRDQGNRDQGNRGGQGQYRDNRGQNQNRGGQGGAQRDNPGGQRPFDNRGGRNNQNFDPRRGGGQNRGGQNSQQNRPYQNSQNRPPQLTNGNVREPEFEDDFNEDGPTPGNENVPGSGSQPPFGGQQGGGYGSEGTGEGGGKRRRRRRGGRRHRRRRERERLAREQAAATGQPYVPPPPRDDDDEEDPNQPFIGANEVGTGYGGEDDRGDEVRANEDRPRGLDAAGEAGPAMESQHDREPEEMQEEPAPPPAAEEAADEPAEEETAPAKPKRGGRKPAAKKGRTAAKKPAAKEAKPKRAVKRTPPKKAASSSSKDEAPVVKTGSADKHLADDEPAEPPPVTRPRRRDDLDAIDDDYD